MSDLSNLFKTPSPSKSLSACHYKPLQMSSMSETRSGGWDISDLQQKMRRGVRKQVQAESMGEQLNIFYNMQREVVFKKTIIIAAAALILYTNNIQGSYLVATLLLIASQLFSTTILPLHSLKVINLINSFQYLLYFCVLYIFLKWATGTNNHQISWPLTLAAIIGTIAHLIIQLYTPFFNISSRSLIGEAVRQPKWMGKLSLFPKYLIHRVKMLLAFSKYLIIMVFVLSTPILLIFNYFNQLSIQSLSPLNILISILTFTVFELFFYLLTFMNESMTQDLKLSKIMKDKVPMFLNLLRLEYKPLNRQVQLQCLKCIYLKIYQVSSFLANQTSKSLIYTTYMDIFNQYTVIEMEKMSSIIMKFNTDANINDKVVKTQKSMLQDILIYFRKKRAELSSQWEMLKLIQALADLNYLFLIINKIEKDSEYQDITVSRRVIDLVRAIKQRLGECAQRISLSSYARGELTSLYHNFASYQFWIREKGY